MMLPHYDNSIDCLLYQSKVIRDLERKLKVAELALQKIADTLPDPSWILRESTDALNAIKEALK